MKEAAELVSYIVTQITGSPDCFHLATSIDENGVLLALSVDTEYAGRVIGKSGATANSIRTVLKALGTRNNAKYNLKIEITGE